MFTTVNLFLSLLRSFFLSLFVFLFSPFTPPLITLFLSFSLSLSLALSLSLCLSLFPHYSDRAPLCVFLIFTNSLSISLTLLSVSFFTLATSHTIITVLPFKHRPHSFRPICLVYNSMSIHREHLKVCPYFG